MSKAAIASAASAVSAASDASMITSDAVTSIEDLVGTAILLLLL